MPFIKNIVFDFDGTMADTAPLIVKTMQATIQEMGLPPQSDQACQSTIGLRLEDVPGVLWPEAAVTGEEFAGTYRRLFDDLKRSFGITCFPGVIETLRALSDCSVHMAIASSRSRKSLEEYVDLFGLQDCFDMLVGGNDVTHGKPAPEPVHRILDSLRWNAGETLTVGDAAFDILMGKAAGSHTCAVTYGNGTVAELESAGPDYIISDITSILPIVNGVNKDIIKYVESDIIPRYADFDKAHRSNHAAMVIAQSLRLADNEPTVDKTMAYVIAAFHDLGLINGRENHHIDSRKILESDQFIKSRFTEDQIHIMGEAVEDHRASKSGKPRSVYGLIVAEADRFIDAETIIRRTIQYGLKHYPHLDREGHYNRTAEHLAEKYGYGGYLKVWLPYSDNADRLEELRRIIVDRNRLRLIFERLFDQEGSYESSR